MQLGVIVFFLVLLLCLEGLEPSAATCAIVGDLKSPPGAVAARAVGSGWGRLTIARLGAVEGKNGTTGAGVRPGL